MNNVKLPKEQLLKVKIFASLFIVVGIIGAFQSLVGLVILLIGILLFAINLELEIDKEFNTKLNIKFFSITLFSIKEKICYPNYISIMDQNFSTSNDFSTVSALGSTADFNYYIIRFFDKNNRNEIIFKTKNKSEVLQKGNQLSELLNVDLINKLKN